MTRPIFLVGLVAALAGCGVPCPNASSDSHDDRCDPIVAGRADDALHLQSMRVAIANESEAREALVRNDDFLQAVSPLDRAARLRSATPVSQEEFVAHLAKQALEPSPA